ncbi:MFS transporter [Lacticigenium naphthae]|uniref:MFS transporter n=1 Tax=Lacticigenium naphthae TaxID=515351 RepID=UPI0003F6FB87|nr:MFS transporter [Lacticigenium naphthae]
MPNKSIKHFVVLFALMGLVMGAIGLPLMTNGVFITPISESLGEYRGAVSMHNTLTMLMKAFTGLYVTRLLKKYPFKLVLLAGVLLTGGANFALGLTRSIWIFNALGIIRGLGSGLLAWVPIMLIINEWFEKKHGLVMSVVLSFSSVTGAIFSPVFANLIETFGWEIAYQLMGGLIILLSLPAILIPFTLDPRDSGLLPYGMEPEEDPLRDIPAEEKTTTIPLTEKREIKGYLFVMMFAFTLMHTMLVGIPQHFPGFARSLSLSSELGATLLSVTMISSIAFKIGLGYISDRIGSVKGTFVVLVSLMLASTIFLLLDTSLWLYGAALLFGAVYAVPSVAVTLLTREFFGRYNFMRLYPILSFATSIGASFSLSVVGFVYDFSGSYLPAFAAAVAITLINMILLFAMYRISCK